MQKEKDTKWHNSTALTDEEEMERKGKAPTGDRTRASSIPEWSVLTTRPHGECNPREERKENKKSAPKALTERGNMNNQKTMIRKDKTTQLKRETKKMLHSGTKTLEKLKLLDAENKRKENENPIKRK